MFAGFSIWMCRTSPHIAYSSVVVCWQEVGIRPNLICLDNCDKVILELNLSGQQWQQEVGKDYTIAIYLSS